MKASPADESALKQLLETAELPNEDLTEDHLEHFFVIRNEDNVLGCVGLEIYKDTGLLRSLAVSKESRGQGLGKKLVRQIESYAREQGIKTLYLLTTTAEEYFGKHGYVVLSREEVPSPIQESEEFATLCPASAIVMRKSID